MWQDTFAIICISYFTAFLGEGLTWLFVYRTEKYKKLKTEVDKQSKKRNRLFTLLLLLSFPVEKQRDSTDISVDRIAKKRLEKQEERLKNINRELSMVKMKSMFAVGIIFTSLFSMFNNIFDGRVVTKLPFVPIPWIQGLSHRNLPGNDYTDASFIFIYMLCTMSIRQNVQKMLGFAPSRAVSKQTANLT
ncbi:Transmembrane and coiled-coil domain-containing protein 1 [Fasciolopsis buskii]|uniref:Calcium load-activated calcium channel n=1 Tax=Fasciolopsis buskii TaxID=27845 RepID=A0A8E0RS67_9TREM|nr:Transmembrane and coiled-coil domain-containing protein 1 [Fasciolopsis buski]